MGERPHERIHTGIPSTGIEYPGPEVRTGFRVKNRQAPVFPVDHPVFHDIHLFGKCVAYDLLL
jgi:hypothetical protein